MIRRHTLCGLNIHYSDVIMNPMASQITGVSLVCTTVCSGTDQRKHQSSASLAFVSGIHWWPVDSPHKGPVTRIFFSVWWRHHDMQQNNQVKAIWHAPYHTCFRHHTTEWQFSLVCISGMWQSDIVKSYLFGWKEEGFNFGTLEYIVPKSNWNS